MEVATSILSAKNAKERVEVVKKLNDSDTDYIHFDVADGVFVPNKSLCIPELVKLIKLSKKKNDVHLMVADPMKYIEQLKKLNVDCITIHVEINKALKEIIENIKKSNIKVGLAIDLNTNVDFIKPYLKMIDRVLIMTVKAGKGGQEFQVQALDKIKSLPKNIELEFDGGINNETINYVRFADIVVSGTYVLKNIEENLKILKSEN